MVRTPYSLQQRCKELANLSLIAVCHRAIDRYTEIAIVASLRSGKNTLCKALRQATQGQWYRTLKSLRELLLSGQGNSSKCTALLTRWQRFGQALELDEVREKVEYDREMKKAAQLCAWAQCVYHQEKPPSPVRTCVGCGEVRYCSKTCQQKCVALRLDALFMH